MSLRGDARTVLLLGAGVMRATDLAAQVVQRATGAEGVHPYLKTAFAGALALLGARRFADDRRDALLIAGGVAAAAAYMHDVQRVLRRGDDAVTASAQVVQMRAPRVAKPVGAPYVQPL
jgi:hypothetical protein